MPTHAQKGVSLAIGVGIQSAQRIELTSAPYTPGRIINIPMGK